MALVNDLTFAHAHDGANVANARAAGVASLLAALANRFAGNWCRCRLKARSNRFLDLRGHCRLSGNTPALAVADFEATTTNQWANPAIGCFQVFKQLFGGIITLEGCIAVLLIESQA